MKNYCIYPRVNFPNTIIFKNNGDILMALKKYFQSQEGVQEQTTEKIDGESVKAIKRRRNSNKMLVNNKKLLYI